MSGYTFDIASSKPVVREAASMQNDGGGGNLGYMQQGENREEEKRKQCFDESIFSKKNEFDSFVFEKDLEGFEDEGFSIAKFVAKIIIAVKDFLKIK